MILYNLFYVAISVQIQQFREGQYFSSDNAKYGMLFLVLLSASKLYTHTSLKLRWKNITYTYRKIYVKKIIGQLEKKFMVKLSFQGVLGKQREK